MWHDPTTSKRSSHMIPLGNFFVGTPRKQGVTGHHPSRVDAHLTTQRDEDLQQASNAMIASTPHKIFGPDLQKHAIGSSGSRLAGPLGLANAS